MNSLKMNVNKNQLIVNSGGDWVIFFCQFGDVRLWYVREHNCSYIVENKISFFVEL